MRNIKAKAFRTRSKKGGIAKNIVGITENESVYIEQLILHNDKKDYSPEAEIILKEYKGRILVRRAVSLKRESMGMVMACLADLIDETKIYEKFPGSYTTALVSKNQV